MTFVRDVLNIIICAFAIILSSRSHSNGMFGDLTLI